jgi:hypothetical protein
VVREDNILRGINGESGPPWESVGPLHIRIGPRGRVQYLRGYRPDPRDGSRTSQCGVWATLSRVPRFWDKEYLDLTQGQTGSGADMCPDHTVYSSAPRPSGDPMLPRGPLPVT